MVASPQVWVVVAWQLPLNQTEATASKCAKETLRHRGCSGRSAPGCGSHSGWSGYGRQDGRLFIDGGNTLKEVALGVAANLNVRARADPLKKFRVD